MKRNCEKNEKKLGKNEKKKYEKINKNYEKMKNLVIKTACLWLKNSQKNFREELQGQLLRFYFISPYFLYEL